MIYSRKIKLKDGGKQNIINYIWETQAKPKGGDSCLDCLLMLLPQQTDDL